MKQKLLGEAFFILENQLHEITNCSKLDSMQLLRKKNILTII